MKKSIKKTSLTAKITAICLVITFLSSVILSAVFIVNARSIIQRQVTDGTMDNINALRDQLLARFAAWDALMKFTAANAASILTQGPFDAQAIHAMLRRNAEIQPVALALFTTSNIPWWYEDGWAISHNQPLEWTPQPDWHNWERPWFLAAKANPGSVGYAPPFFSALWPGVLIIALGTNIYDEAGNDLGVIAADIEIGFLQGMVDEVVTMPGHRVHLINREGLFITHPDPDAIMTRNFFSDLGLDCYRDSVLGRPTFSSFAGDTFVYSELIPGIDWILVSTIPTAAIFAEMDQFVLRMVFLGVALLVVAAIVLILFTYRGLSIPIRSIKSAAGSLAAMDFAVDIKKTENDEIGDMQLALLTIRDNLKKGIDDMQNAHLDDIQKAQQHEAALKERMQGILDSSPLVCALYDENLNILEVNKEVEHMFGISDKQMFVDNLGRFLPKSQPDGSDSAGKRAQMAAKALAEGCNRYEWTYLHNDGSQIPVEETAHRISIHGKDHLIVYSRDLCEYYKEKERERVVHGKLQAMMAQFNSHVENQAASVAASSAATEEMIANIRSVTDTLASNSRNVRGLEEASVAGHTSLSEVVTDIQGIARESESLLEINAVMQNIASQTNLLSMNAAIEAAHAGESGRGFAVVADEIRKLAESSSKQSKTIGGVLKSIKGSIDKITKSTDAVLGKFSAIESGVKTVVDQEENILNAMEEQGQGSKQILQAVGNVNEVTHQVKEAALRLVETSKESMHKTDDAETRAYTDDLTGVRNREYFMDSAEQELRYCVGENRDFNLVMFCVDSLERIVDIHGSDIRDEVLKILTQRIRNGLKQGTLLARYGADEFVITLPNVRRETAAKLAEQIQKKVRDAPFAAKGLKLDVSISFGIASKTSGCKTLSDIVDSAEKALSSAKMDGRNKLASFGQAAGAA